MQVREIKIEDAATIQGLAKICQPLLVNGVYVNLFLAKFFGNVCFILEDEETPAGYVTGLRSTYDPEVLFLWQLAVIPQRRGQGCSTLLIEAVFTAARKMGCTRMQFSISPGNDQSLGAFTRFARKNARNMKIVNEHTYVDRKEEHRQLEVEKSSETKAAGPIRKTGHEIFYEIAL